MSVSWRSSQPRIAPPEDPAHPSGPKNPCPVLAGGVFGGYRFGTSHFDFNGHERIVMKKLLLGTCLALGLCCTSCIGPNNAFNGANSWTSRATDSKWWNELINIGMWVAPYPLALTGDVLIFNSLEFWAMENPIGEPQAYTPQDGPGSTGGG